MLYTHANLTNTALSTAISSWCRMATDITPTCCKYTGMWSTGMEHLPSKNWKIHYFTIIMIM